ncbi:Uncharacterised protein [Mycobacteroides abscessus subsp. bolletii]|uniref:DNA/RNA non-specific endonuclease n=1 Tax=Mycobacteroides abscessus TaxID=36809 RepID=UPI00092750CE|nr:DNA/RNA non-specific endonuclease [Mycobacteroides abscessus]SIK00937.1 Uncharacterised protein [Mycobacteroides abscessus subsp. bolletii]
MTTLDEFMAIDPNSYMARVEAWRPRTAALKFDYDDYKRWANAPAGTYWSGKTATAAQDVAADDCKGVDNADDTTEDAVKLVTATITYEVVKPLTNGQNIVNNALHQGVSVSQDFTMAYTPAEGESEESIARNRKIVADAERELQEYVAQWEKGEATLKTQIDAARETMLSRINPKAAFADGRKILRDATAPRPGDPSAQPANFYKDWYPKATDPASVDPGAGTLGDKLEHIKNPATSPTAATAAADPNAPQYGPFAKDTIDKTKVGGLGESVTYMNRNDKPPEEHKPSAAERFKTDISEGIDKGVDKLLSPLTDLRDRLGLGDKGFWEANEEAGRREWESFKHQMTTPPGADIAEGIKHNIENPGQYVGGKLVDGGALMAGGPEGLLPRAGLEQSAAHLGGMHPDLPAPGALHDTPAPAAHNLDDTAPGHQPAPQVEHPAQGGGDHAGSGHGPPSEAHHVSTESGGPGGWNQELNRPAPNTHYNVDERFQYSTDDQRRVDHAEMTYDHGAEPGDRNGHQQRIAGGPDRLPGDQGGHIFGTQFGGPGEAINITAMRDTLNQVGARDYYNLEMQWRQLAEQGQVQVKVDIAYPGDSMRPESYSIETYVDGKLNSTYHFDN